MRQVNQVFNMQETIKKVVCAQAVQNMLQSTGYTATGLHLITGRFIVDGRPREDDHRVIFGHNKKHNNLSSFGGVIEKGETVRDALWREFQEETGGKLMNEQQFDEAVEHPVLVVDKTQTTARGTKRIAVFILGVFMDDFPTRATAFQDYLEKNPDLPPECRENDMLVQCRLRDVMDAVKGETVTHTDQPIVPTVCGGVYPLRNVSVGTYKMAPTFDLLNHFYKHDGSSGPTMRHNSHLYV